MSGSKLSLTQIKTFITEKRTVLIFTILTVAIIMFVLLSVINNRLQPKTQPNQIPTSPTPTSTPTQLPIPPSAAVLEKIVSKLPYETAGFTIRAVPHNNSYRFYIDQKTLSPEKIRKEVENWFMKEGVSDISALEIIWLPVPGSISPIR